ncbi:MAG: sulfide/dihydroorotate dehydrogenase-like FAD/NAD-binding protein [Synergistetes bacterium]|nr:sulfide/dihydroorotate dehydrogenase-like FAD/NAD-binding protein [Synergistota bacterium]MCX8127847.1 sulfide/dihydroorotate dehydrogenase-like FAD/NAD-binding protein [Synergistota bacterium]MDW8192109.1 sulfide/dihydroorotate dehydrogenase-like FAD/NAD-binding protein [Synergistota bacterium]
MYLILSSKRLAPNIFEFIIRAPLVAKNAKAGQFVIVRSHEKGERIPLTIADFDPKNGTITIVFQVAGKTTDELSNFKEGDYLKDLVGPLGNPSDIELFGKVLVVGGGVGIAPIFPIARALKEAGNKVIGIIGARTAELLFWEEKVRNVCDDLIVCTDDGSKGFKGFVTQAMEEVFKANGDIQKCWAIGPLVMMKFATRVAVKYNVPIIVSLNPIMVDGTGMCGACRCTVGGKTFFACSHGPEFNGALVDFDELIKRNERFKEEERIAWERYKSMKGGTQNVQS